MNQTYCTTTSSLETLGIFGFAYSKKFYGDCAKHLWFLVRDNLTNRYICGSLLSFIYKIKHRMFSFLCGRIFNSTIKLLTVISSLRVVDWKMSIINLSEEQVASLLTWPLVYDAVEQALRSVSEIRTSDAQPSANSH